MGAFITIGTMDDCKPDMIFAVFSGNMYSLSAATRTSKWSRGIVQIGLQNW